MTTTELWGLFNRTIKDIQVVARKHRHRQEVHSWAVHIKNDVKKRTVYMKGIYRPYEDSISQYIWMLDGNKGGRNEQVELMTTLIEV